MVLYSVDSIVGRKCIWFFIKTNRVMFMIFNNLKKHYFRGLGFNGGKSGAKVHYTKIHLKDPRLTGN